MFRYLRFITFSRTANFAKLLAGFWASRLLRRPVRLGRPFAVSIEPGTSCSLHCPECPTGAGVLKRPAGKISVSMYKDLLEELLPELTVLNLYLQGEPMMHPDFAELVKIASRKNIYTITSSNGQVFSRSLAEKLVENGLSEIYFSMDGITQQVYEKYRAGGELGKVENAIKVLAEVKKQKKKNNPVIVAQFIVFRHNEHEAEAFKKVAKDLGADRAELKTAQFNEFGGNEVSPPDDTRYARYADAEKLLLKRKGYNHCWKSWMSLVFTWDGTALPCCYDKDGEYSFGRYTAGNFNDLWGGDKIKGFRSIVLRKKSDLKMCSNCPEGRSFFF